MENNINQNRSIKRSGVFSSIGEAFRLINGIKWIVFKRAMLVFCLIIALSFLIILILWFFLFITNNKLIDLSTILSNPMLHVFLKLCFITIAIRLWAPVLIVGVRRAIGLPVELKLIRLECSRVGSSLLILSCIHAVLFVITANGLTFLSGDILFWATCRGLWRIVVTILLVPITFFAFPLVVIQKAPVFSALSSAYRKMVANFSFIAEVCLTLYLPVASVLGLILLYGLYNPLATKYFLPFAEAILSIWLLPLAATVGGVLFRDVYRLRKATKLISSDE